MALQINLHPLVLMNISDQLTRTAVQTNLQNPRVVGVLVGTVEGRNVQIQNSFEVPYTKDEEGFKLDNDFITRRLGLISQIFPNFEFLGWYSTGKLSQEDLLVQRSLETFSENPLYLLLNTQDPIHKQGERLPVQVFEMAVQVSENATSHEFRELPYSIETTDAERISVDYASKTGATAGGSSEYSTSLETFLNALFLFKKRLLKLLEAVENNPEVRNDHKVMRKVHEICNRIPVAPAEKLKSEFNKELGEELLTGYMSGITKAMNLMSELVNRFEILSSSHI